MPTGVTMWSNSQTEENPRSSAVRATSRMFSGGGVGANVGRCTPIFIGRQGAAPLSARFPIPLFNPCVQLPAPGLPMVFLT